MLKTSQQTPALLRVGPPYPFLWQRIILPSPEGAPGERTPAAEDGSMELCLTLHPLLRTNGGHPDHPQDTDGAGAGPGLGLWRGGSFGEMGSEDCPS